PALRRRAHWTGGDARQGRDGTGVGGRGAALQASDECGDRRGPVHLGADGGEPCDGSAAQVRDAGPAQPGPARRRDRGDGGPWRARGCRGGAAGGAAFGEPVAGHRLATAVGPGGVGKTRLAISVAADLAEERRDGTWFVDLVRVADPAVVVAAVAEAVGVPE